MGYRGAYLTMLGANILLLCLLCRLLRTETQNLRCVFPYFAWALFAAFLPIAAALMQGQDSILLLTLLVLASFFLQRNKPIPAGVLVGAGLFKFQLVIPIALLFLTWRRWRFILGFCTSAAAAALVSVWLVGFNASRAYGMSLVSMSANRFTYPIPVTRMANLHGLVTGLGLPALLAPASLLVLGLAAWQGGKAANQLLVAIAATVLVSYYLLIHDMSVVFFPLMVVLNRFIGAETEGKLRERIALWSIAVLFVAPLMMSYSPDRFYLVAVPLLWFLWAVSLHKQYRACALKKPRDQNSENNSDHVGRLGYCCRN